MQNPFSWHYLTAPVYDTPVWGPLSVTYIILFSVGFIASILIYNNIGGRLRRNTVLFDALRQASSILMPIFGLGLLFFLFRFLHVSALGLHMRLWLYLTALALLVVVGYYAYFFRTVYPRKVAAVEAERVKQRYLVPAVAGGSGSSRRRSRKRKKR